MLDMGFVDAVKMIAAATPATRQTLLFSATLEGRVLAIAKALLKDPARVQLAANHERHASIEQRIYPADDLSHKHRLLSHYLAKQELTQAVIFTSTKRGADRLAQSLTEQGHASAALHGDMGQHARRRTVEQMRRGKFRLLVATDVAARGLDIKGISHVINFDLPMAAEDYIHRIGRTGRGGATGTAVSLIGPDDWSKLAGIERLTGAKLARQTVPGLEPTKSEPRFAPRRAAGGFNPRGNSGGYGARSRSSQEPRRRGDAPRHDRRGAAARPARRS